MSDTPPVVDRFRAQLAALPEPGAPAPRRAPRWVWRAAAAGALAAVVLLALQLRSGDAPSAADRAYAAVGVRSGVLHIRFRFVTRDRSGRVTGDEAEESWSVRGGPWRVVITRRVNGRMLRAESAMADGIITSRTGSGPVTHKPVRVGDIGLDDPAETFRKRYEEGRVHERGTVTHAGSELIRFRFRLGSSVVDYEVDPTSYLPVFIRLANPPFAAAGGTVTVTRVERYEYLPLDETTKPLLRLAGR